MRNFWFVCVVFIFAASPLAAGVVFEVEVRQANEEQEEAELVEVSVDKKNLKMDMRSGARDEEGEVIFRGDREEMVVVEHNQKSYAVVNQEALEGLGNQVSQAMSQMQEALKNVPEEQRALVEQMMKERLPAAAAPKMEPPEIEVRKVGDRATHGGYPCVNYEVWQDGKKKRELWVTDWDNVEGGKDARDAFIEMSEFFEDMLDAVGAMGGGAADYNDNMFLRMKDLGGFPVVTREFAEDGTLESESTLRSSTRRELDPADFEPPAGYRRQEMFAGG